jgi:hypothetical protein
MNFDNTEGGGAVSVPFLSTPMKRIRVQMIRTIDSLIRGTTYLLPSDMANRFIVAGFAVPIDPPGPKEMQVVGPSETKPVQPSEIKAKKKRNG